MTAVEFLAERYNYITWMRNRDEISAGTADEWRAKFLKEAKEMEKQQTKPMTAKEFFIKEWGTAFIKATLSEEKGLLELSMEDIYETMEKYKDEQKRIPA